LYSSSNSFTANSNDWYFSRPALKNTDPTPIRIASRMTENGNRSSQPRTVTNQIRGAHSPRALWMSVLTSVVPRDTQRIAPAYQETGEWSRINGHNGMTDEALHLSE
jgi:hypothetical protein